MLGNSGHVYKDGTLCPTEKPEGEGTSTGFCQGDMNIVLANKESCFGQRYCIHEFILDISYEINRS